MAAEVRASQLSRPARADSQAYCLLNPLVIPLNDFLFGNAVNDGMRTVIAVAPRTSDRVVAAVNFAMSPRGYRF